MRILNIRQADLINEFYVTSEVEIVRSLNKLGHPTTLVGVGNGKRDFGTSVKLINAPARRTSIFRLKLLFLLPYWVVFRRVDIVMVDVRTAFTTLTIIPLKWLGLCKIILDVRTIPVESNVNWRFTSGLKFAKRWFNGASIITVGTRDHISQKMGVTFKDSVIWTSGVNVDLFSPTRVQKRADIIDKSAGRFVIFYHGTITPNRGVTDVLDAINEIKDEIPDVLFISLSNNNQYLLNHCKTKGYQLDAHLLLLDVVPNTEVPSLILAADFCIVPLPRIDWWEVSSPLKLMEYLSMAKPTLMTDIKAHLEVVPRDASFAIYYNPDIPGDLVGKLRLAHAERSTYGMAGVQARKHISETFTWDHQASKLVNFLQAV